MNGKLIKLSNLSNEEIFNEFKDHIPFEFPHPTKDCCKVICNEDQLQRFIADYRNEYWFDAIGYQVEDNELTFLWDADTHNRVIAERKEYYNKKAEFIARWGCE